MPNDCLSRIYHLYYVIRERRVASPDFDEQPGIGSGKSPIGNMRWISGCLFSARNMFMEKRIHANPTEKAKNSSIATKTTIASYPIGERAETPRNSERNMAARDDVVIGSSADCCLNQLWHRRDNKCLHIIYRLSSKLWATLNSTLNTSWNLNNFEFWADFLYRTVADLFIFTVWVWIPDIADLFSSVEYILV